MASGKCSSCGEGGFPILNTEDPISILPDEEWLESKLGMFRVWHVIFMVMGSIMSVIVCICCCVRFRIPRTKQEIEADYVRKRITRKFQKQLRMIENAEMDEMDLKRALDRVRAEFKSDTDSIAQSEAFSISSGLPLSPNEDIQDGRRGSNINIGVSIEDLIERRNSGLGARIASFVGTFNILRTRKKSGDTAPQQNTKMGV